MGFRTPSSTTASRAGLAVLGIAAVWFVVHAAIYAAGMFRFDSVLYKHLEHALKHFVGWQILGFFLVALIVHARRPAIMGRVLGGYLIASVLVLLAFSQDAAMVGKLAVLLLWNVCAVVGIRQALAWGVGERYATWGVAAASVYAALVPICFFLGVLHGITPLNVTILAIASALPGAVVGTNYLLKRNVKTTNGSVAVPGEKWSFLAWCLIEVILIVLAIEFIGACTPEVRSDSVRVHLPCIQQMIADHGVSHQYACWHRLQPMAVQTYGAAIATVGTIAATKWFSWLALVALVLLIVEEVRLRSGSWVTGLFAGAAVLSCPVLAGLSRALYADHVMALLCTAAFIVLFRALRPPCFRGILFSAAIVASMVQIKYTGLVFACVWGLFLAADLLRQRGWRVALAWSAAGGTLALAMALPWYVYVYLGTGNPFYPYLHHWFPSPYWADNFTLQQIFEATFKLSPGFAGVMSFPWVATYQTGCYVEGHDGVLGFWVLALMPCWFIAWRRDGAPYWDMVIAGVAMIAGIVMYTPYVRYWLPAYPLLVASCVLAAGSLLQSISWRPAWRWSPALSCIATALLLLLPMPLLCVNMPWDVYAKRISKEEYLAQQFAGYPTMQQLNAIMKPDDGVLCSGCDGVYLLGGRPYEFAFWWNTIHHIRDIKSFADFCRQCGIRYWIVNHGVAMGQAHGNDVAIAAKYWTDARLVMATGSVAVYDVTLLTEKNKPMTRRQWPTVLEESPKPWTFSDQHKNWVQLTVDAARYEGKGVIGIEGKAWLAHRIEPVYPGGMCRVNIGLWSGETSTVLLEIKWFDEKGNLLSQINSSCRGGANYDAIIYCIVPLKAKIGWFNVHVWPKTPQKSVQMKRGSVIFWKKDDTAPVVRRSLPSDDVKAKAASLLLMPKPHF